MTEPVRERKPTEMAEIFFSAAANTAFPGIVGNALAPKDLANIFHKIAAGLEEMAIGLRATYILLAEVKELIRRQNIPPAGRS